MRWCVYCGAGGILGLAFALASSGETRAAPPLTPTGPKINLPPIRPDLHIMEMRRIGASPLVAVRVRNAGPVATTQTCVLRATLLAIPNPEQAGVVRYAKVPPLKAAESRWVFVPYAASLLNNPCLVTVHVDYNDQIAERNEGNNTFRRQFP